MKLAWILEEAHLYYQDGIPRKIGVLDIYIKNREALAGKRKLVDLVFITAKKPTQENHLYAKNQKTTLQRIEVGAEINCTTRQAHLALELVLNMPALPDGAA